MQENTEQLERNQPRQEYTKEEFEVMMRDLNISPVQVDEYLSDKVKSFILLDNTKVEGEVELRVEYLAIRAQEITDAHIKRFCEMVNFYADKGFIEYGSMIPISKLVLVLSEDEVLMYYPATRYTLEQLKEMCKDYHFFTPDGEPTEETFQ